MSRLIFRGGVKRFHPALAAGSFWRKMCTLDIIFGSQLLIDLSSLKYDASLFQEGHNFILQRLPALHRSLGTSVDSQRYKFTILMWLSTMTFDQDADVSMLQSVAMFFNSPVLAQVRAPKRVSFSPKLGNTNSRSALSGVIEQYYHPLELCPEGNLMRHKNKRRANFHNRRRNIWHYARSSTIVTLQSRLATQWPCEIPDTPDVPSSYIRVHEAILAVKSLFKNWYDNRLLDQYLASIE